MGDKPQRLPRWYEIANIVETVAEAADPFTALRVMPAVAQQWQHFVHEHPVSAFWRRLLESAVPYVRMQHRIMARVWPPFTAREFSRADVTMSPAIPNVLVVTAAYAPLAWFSRVPLLTAVAQLVSAAVTPHGFSPRDVRNASVNGVIVEPDERLREVSSVVCAVKHAPLGELVLVVSLHAVQEVPDLRDMLAAEPWPSSVDS